MWEMQTFGVPYRHVALQLCCRSVPCVFTPAVLQCYALVRTQPYTTDPVAWKDFLEKIPFICKVLKPTLVAQARAMKTAYVNNHMARLFGEELRQGEDQPSSSSHFLAILMEV